jgi:hypothetical protein
MNWTDLSIVAVDSIGSFGAAVYCPFVCDRDGAIYKIGNIEESAPATTVRCTKEAIDDGISAGLLLRLPSWLAKRGHVVLVISDSLQRTGKRIGITFNFQESAQVGGKLVAYLPLEQSEKWRKNSSYQLIRWARKQVLKDASGITKLSAKDVEEALRQARYLIARGSDLRREMYVILGLVLGKTDPDRWKVVLDLAIRDLGIDDRVLNDLIDRRRRRLLSKGKTRRPVIFKRRDVRASKEPLHSICLQ